MELIRDSNSSRAFYFPELDGLRFLAFLLVFFHHRFWYPIQAFSYLHRIGGIGVDLFFALSAYLFTKLLVTEYNVYGTISLSKFYMRRIFRIWPLYFFIILLSLLYYLFVQKHQISELESFRITGLLTFTENFYNAFHGFTSLPFISPLWTISYEEQFYLFIPFIILFLVKSKPLVRWIFAFIIIITFVLVRNWLINIKAPFPTIAVLPFTRFEAMVLGIIAGFGGLDPLLKYIRPVFLALIAITCFYAIAFFPQLDEFNPKVAITFLLIGVFSVSLLLAVCKSAYLKVLFSHPILVFLGKRSYGLYVYHTLANTLLDHIVALETPLPITPETTFFYALFITIVLSAVSYQWIEKPFLRLKRKFERIESRPI